MKHVDGSVDNGMVEAAVIILGAVIGTCYLGRGRGKGGNTREREGMGVEGEKRKGGAEVREDGRTGG